MDEVGSAVGALMPSEFAQPRVLALAQEIDRLRAEGTKRMEWVIRLIDHTKALSVSYTRNWHTPDESDNAV